MGRNGFVGIINSLAREAARAERARQRETSRNYALAARELKASQREAKRQERQSRLEYLESRQAEAEELTQAVKDTERAISQLLLEALNREPTALAPATRIFEAGRYVGSESPGYPSANDYIPPPLGFFSKHLPGASGRLRKRVEAFKEQLDQAVARYDEKLTKHLSDVDAFNRTESDRRSAIDRHNSEASAQLSKLLEADHSVVIAVYQRILEDSFEPEIDALSVALGYASESKHLVADLELPELAVIPEETTFKYSKASDTITSTARSATKRKTLYANLLCQIALKAVATVFRTSPAGPVSCVTLNGMIDAIDRATGQEVRACLLSVRVTSDTFEKLVLQNVQPEQCMRALSASMSRSPDELVPVKPFIELDMFDPRFVATTDALSGLDSRPNLMDLTPSEFEGLITQLFGSMGLDTRQTRASRDGGVDCVAFDPRPIFGGKVVIQAKRYKNTVGVSAVRDLFGTVQNEGASKGILVTTSGYGKAAFDFARGKPLELLDGANLLYLLKEHADLEAKIVMPEDWIDLPVHGQ
jgi:restriction system protein